MKTTDLNSNTGMQTKILQYSDDDDDGLIIINNNKSS